MARAKTTKMISDGSEKALQNTLDTLNKKFGKGIVMSGNERVGLEVETFPTGSMGLDRALGVGGYPVGRIIEIYGPEGSGKCLPADTKVWLPGGILTVAELFERAGLKATCTSRTTECTVELINRYGDSEHTTHFTHNNRKPVFEVKLADGSSVKSTANHPHLVMSTSGNWVWRRTSEIKPGDYVVKLARVRSPDRGIVFPEQADTAYALGALVADGCFVSESRISFTNNDPVVVDLVLRLMSREGFEIKEYPRPENNTTEYHFSGKEKVAAFMEKYGLSHGCAEDKLVPIWVRYNEDAEADVGSRFRSFLQGYIECEGYFDTKKRCIEVTSASKELLLEVQQMLYFVGVRSSIAPKVVDGVEYHMLVVSGDGWNTYLREMYPSSQIRQEQVGDARDAVSAANQGLDVVPHVRALLRDLYDSSETTREHNAAVYDYVSGGHDVSVGKLQEILSLPWAECAPLRRLKEISQAPYVYVPVVSVDAAGDEPTFDFAMKDTHSFIANGIVTHNTTLTLHAIAEVQKQGGRAAFIDAEHALDPQYASRIGVDIDSLLISQPDCGEDALEIAEALVLSGAVKVVVVDSVAALVPRAEIQGEMGDHHVGLQARLMSQALRKLAGAAYKTGTTVFFINQLRMKIGVMFGCFHYTTRVTLADGSSEKIGKIVNQKMPVEVLSYNAETGKVEPRRVVNWFNNGKADYFLQFVTEKCGGNGVSRFAATPNHTIITPRGEVAAGDLEVGDEVYIKAEERFGPTQLSVALGSCLGDGSLRKSGKLVSLRIGHGRKQVAYAQWKAELFGDLVSYQGPNAAGGWGFDLVPTYDLAKRYHYFYTNEGRRTVACVEKYPGGPRELAIAEDFDELALAIWYMDDGSFSGHYEKWGNGKSEISVKSYTTAERQMLAELIGKLLGTENTPTVTDRGTLLFSGKRTEALHAAIARYVHPSMNYKLHPKFRDEFDFVPEPLPEPRYCMVPGKILDIYIKPETRSMNRFDLEVEGNHTYLVDGVAVHNSNETTTGGNALKFYSSIRLDVRRTSQIKEGDQIVGSQHRVRVVKNKVAPPFRECTFDMRGSGIEFEAELIDHAVEHGLIEKSGAWYSLAGDGERIGQGRTNAIQCIKDRDDLRESLVAQLRSIYARTGVSSTATRGEIIDEETGEIIEIGE